MRVKWGLVRKTMEEKIENFPDKCIDIRQEDFFCPVLIAARNEALLIQSTLRSIMESMLDFRARLASEIFVPGKAHPQCRYNDITFLIYICDNNSCDNTIGKVEEFIRTHAAVLAENNIDIRLTCESGPGKVNALKNLISVILEDKGLKFRNVIFTDADVLWQKNMYMSLVLHKINNPGIKLIGTSLCPLNKQVNFWGRLELLPYYGYGELLPHGHGLFFCFVSGMGYLADRETLHFLADEIPPEIGNEDVAVSVLVGKENIHILTDTKVYYYVAKSCGEFLRIRGRHIRELYKLFFWLRQWRIAWLQNRAGGGNKKMRDLTEEAHLWCKKNFYPISENRLLPYVSGYYRSTVKFGWEAKRFKQWFLNIPAVKLGLSFIMFLHPVALFIYGLTTAVSFIQSQLNWRAGWEPDRLKTLSEMEH